MIREELKIWLILILVGMTVARDAQIVDEWAERLGTELWDLANAVARPEEIKTSYKDQNARVEDKSGEELIDIISESVGRMLRRKMDAVKCIREFVENAADEWNGSFTGNVSYVSGRYSPVVPEYYPVNDSSIYRAMVLTNDSHFYNIPVNTSYSSVHVPTNVYDQTQAVAEAIRWSEDLDDTFCKNYRSDPALSWQYFGSSTGILRQYPAMQWRTEKSDGGPNEVDTYDCRTRSWFIEAATCNKHMVILYDRSGSMLGMGNTIAKTTVSEILNTLSNNDLVTILSFSENTTDVVPCFKDRLVQATPENLNAFKLRIKDIRQEGNANLTEAFTKAFNLLEMHRKDNETNADKPCNQAIMLVTDGVPGNLTEVFRSWNWRDNGTHIPVRVFTYLLGREVTKVREIQWMACLNRGYYSHVHSLEEVREQVLKYIPVIARPLVLKNEEHPVSWTHAYVDRSNPALATWLWLVMEHSDQKSPIEKLRNGEQLDARNNEDTIHIEQLSEDEDVQERPWRKYKLMTSVSIPAFDRKTNRNNASRTATLLGVAGTDVPIDDIQRLTLPYKLGVNGYAFIVSNNGYVILHPDLRPSFEGNLNINYNSIDLTEVEILNDTHHPRDPGPKVKELRAAMVERKKGSMKGITVKLHYDDNRRVTLENRDYFYAPLPETTFGLAVTLPEYGTTWIKVGDEIQRNQNENVVVSDFFVGDRWRVHPGWVYCRFHYLEGHEFDSPEEELKHFLAALDEPGWYWADQYEAYPIDDSEEKLDCEGQILKEDDYYCNRELMQLLVFDAKATNRSFTEDFAYNNDEQKNLTKEYKVFLRFVATQSGLTRWQIMDADGDGLPDERTQEEFGDVHRRAVNEPWYKGAIFQHNIDPDSISLTVSQKIGENATVTASQGIFPKDGGKEAPAAVIGFQMPVKALYKRFREITKQSSNLEMSCFNDSVACYLMDQNGYAVISENPKESGRFLGILEGAVMASMVEQHLYIPVVIYDYQALCSEDVIVGAAFRIQINPLKQLASLLTWFLIRLTWLTAQFVDLPGVFAKFHLDEDEPDSPPPPFLRTRYYSCDEMRTLYILNQTIADGGIANRPDDCCRPYFAQKVPHTNLLLVVVDVTYSSCYRRLEVRPTEISYTDSMQEGEDTPCKKLDLSYLIRSPKNCVTEHPLEDEIEACGRGSRQNVSLLLFIIANIFTFTRHCKLLQ